MLHQLPTEIALHTISYLPLHSLYSATRVSHDWNALISINEPTVYRNAAVLHCFINNDQLRTDSVPINWKAYCQRQLEIERGWHGKAPSAVRELTATGSFVHRIKVDPEHGFIITTCQTGGLSVCDIKSNRILWSLSPSYVVRFAHCEYGGGYIVFNRHDNCKEIWRRTVDAEGDHPPETSPPDNEMLKASMQAAAIVDPAETRRGHFTAWALLYMPEITRAFRFSYPTLLAAAKDNAYVWDVPRSQLTSVIRDIQQPHHGLTLGNINYVEVNDLYVFICGEGGMRIFAREGGALLYQLSPRELSSATWDVRPQTCGLATSVVHPHMLLRNMNSLRSHDGQFIACHVSASGNDLAVLTSNGQLVLLPDFQRLFSMPHSVHHRDIAIVVNFQPFSNDMEISYYLAVGDRNGKLAVATRKGIYVISPDFDFNRLTASQPPEPGMSVCRLSKFDSGHLLSFISCLQITHDAIYFTYKPSRMNGTLNPVHHAHAHDDDVHGPLEVVAFPHIDDVEDGFNDGWEDDEQLELGAGDDDDPVHAILNNWFLPTSPNTVYRVSF